MSISENLLLATFVIFARPWAVWRALGGKVILSVVMVQIGGQQLAAPEWVLEAIPVLEFH